MKSVNFSDVVNGYIYVLFGFIAHIYLVFSSSLYLSLFNKEALIVGVSNTTLVNYFALISIFILLFSLYSKWTWPFKVEEVLIVFFIWVLLRNILPKDCACCNPPPPTAESMGIHIDGKAPTSTPTKEETSTDVLVSKIEEDKIKPPEDCSGWQNSTILYSVLCVLVMLSSFLMNARNNAISIAFTVTTIVLVIFTTLIPTSCNQLNVADFNTHLIKFTLYSIVWFLNRRMRLSERILSIHYLRSIQILYTYEDTHQKHLLCGVTHKKRRKQFNYRGTLNRHCHDECDEIDYFINECTLEEALIPRPLFDKLDLLCNSVIMQKNPQGSSRLYRDRVDEVKARHHASQIRNVQKIHHIHHEYNHFFSWKHRLYDPEIQNIFDLSKTLWILNVCPLFLLFVLLEYFLLNYHIHWNIKELKCLIRHVKVMRHIQCQGNLLSEQRRL